MRVLGLDKFYSVERRRLFVGVLKFVLSQSGDGNGGSLSVIGFASHFCT